MLMDFQGFEQLDVGSSPTATYSPSRKAASKYDGPLTLASYSFASQSPLTDDRMSATLPSRGGFQRGALGHYASETKRSPLVTKQLPWATKQYSSLTAADCRQLYYQQVVSLVVLLFIVWSKLQLCCSLKPVSCCSLFSLSCNSFFVV